MGCCGSSSQPAAPPAAAADKTLIAPSDKATTVEANSSVPAKAKATRPNVVAMLDEVFDKCDANGDGTVSREELAAALDNLLKCSDLESQKSLRELVSESGLNPYFNVFDQVDSNHDGRISKQEFQEHMHPAKAGKVLGQLLREVFDGIDVNKDGSLSRKELESAYEKLLNTTEEKSGKNWKNLLLDAGLNPDFYVFEQLDTNGDDKVTWDEFSKTLQPTPDLKLFLRRTFDRLDVNGDGSINREELTAEFTRILDMPSPLVDKKTFRMLLKDAGFNPDFYVFEQLDTNHDDRITWAEFEANFGVEVREEEPQSGDAGPEPDAAEGSQTQAAGATTQPPATGEQKKQNQTEVVLEEKKQDTGCICGL